MGDVDVDTRNMVPKPGESPIVYLRRMKFGMLRRIIPSVREKHRLAQMAGPVRYWEQIQKYQFNFLMTMGLQPHHTFLDIGCGPLSGGLVLIPYLQAGNYVGIDVRKTSIAEAYIQIAKSDLVLKNPSLVVSESFGRHELGERKFDYVWASQVLYHLDDEKIKMCLEHISDRMKPGTKFYGDILGFPNKVWGCPDLQWHEFRFYLHTIDFVSKIAEEYNLKVADLGEIQNFNYPKEAGWLRTNKMLEFTKN